MIRSVLVALDGSASSVVAQSLAIGIARGHDARVSGIGIVDSPWITRPEPVPIGSTWIKQARDLAQLQTAHERIHAVLNGFESAAAASGVPHAYIEAEGDPATLIETEAVSHDLILIGHEADFHFDEKKTSPLLDRLVRESARPLIIAPKRPVSLDTVLVTYDGSATAARAAHMFALLGLANGDTQVGVVSIDPIPRAAEDKAERIRLLLARYGVEARAIGIESETSPAEIILTQAKSLGAGIIVMGAFGHRGLREMLIGSTTQDLIEACPAALFVHR